MQDDQQKTFQPNLRLLSFSLALAGKDKPSNTTIGMTPAFFTEIKHLWKISPHLGNYNEKLSTSKVKIQSMERRWIENLKKNLTYLAFHSERGTHFPFVYPT